MFKKKQNDIKKSLAKSKLPSSSYLVMRLLNIHIMRFENLNNFIEKVVAKTKFSQGKAKINEKTVRRITMLLFPVLFSLPVAPRNLCFLSSLPKPCDYKELLCKEQTPDMAKGRKILINK